jgi:hypothetical protein
VGQALNGPELGTGQLEWLTLKVASSSPRKTRCTDLCGRCSWLDIDSPMPDSTPCGSTPSPPRLSPPHFVAPLAVSSSISAVSPVSCLYFNPSSSSSSWLMWAGRSDCPGHAYNGSTSPGVLNLAVCFQPPCVVDPITSRWCSLGFDAGNWGILDNGCDIPSLTNYVVCLPSDTKGKRTFKACAIFQCYRTRQYCSGSRYQMEHDPFASSLIHPRYVDNIQGASLILSHFYSNASSQPRIPGPSGWHDVPSGDLSTRWKGSGIGTGLD